MSASHGPKMQFTKNEMGSMNTNLMFYSMIKCCTMTKNVHQNIKIVLGKLVRIITITFLNSNLKSLFENFQEREFKNLHKRALRTRTIQCMSASHRQKMQFTKNEMGSMSTNLMFYSTIKCCTVTKTVHQTIKIALEKIIKIITNSFLSCNLQSLG